MKIWQRARNSLRNWRSVKKPGLHLPDEHLLEANRNLRDLLEDTSIPSPVRQALEPEFREMEAISEKLSRQEIHIAACGRVGTGKSSLLNALAGESAFATSPLHGETRVNQQLRWRSPGDSVVELIDTPGIDELDGLDREKLALEVARRADILLFVCEGDLTDTEFEALQLLAARKRPLVLVLNKSDRYTATELETLVTHLTERCEPLVDANNVLVTSADPRPETVVRVTADGKEEEFQRKRAPEVHELRDRLWQVLQAEGKSLAALNAALFASELDSRVAEKIVLARQDIADQVIRNYCIGKGLAVAANPIPVADLLAAAGIDIAMVTHLGQIYGHQLSRREALKLLMSIAAQLSALLGAYWGVNLVSSALKGVSAGMSTVLTGTAQGALAWYATYVIGKAAQSWFARGKTWGPDGPRNTVRDIVDNLDRDSIIISAREEILALLDQPVSRTSAPDLKKSSS